MFMLSGKNILLNMRGEHFEHISEICQNFDYTLFHKSSEIKKS